MSRREHNKLSSQPPTGFVHLMTITRPGTTVFDNIPSEFTTLGLWIVGGGRGGGGRNNNATNRGGDATFYGAGGGGGAFSSNHGYGAGGAGYQGIVIIYGKTS